MPKWGLTREQRDARPWGLPADALEPDKVITDPIHGEIYINNLEREFLDSPALQRLRRVRQLGTTHLVYPGASHSRFSHSLGALRSAQDLVDVVVSHRHGPYRVQDIFDEWGSAWNLQQFEKAIAEATTLARLGALLHDICHVPFGHSIEDDLGILNPHDENVPRFERLWSELPASLRELVAGDLTQALRPLILSKEKNGAPPEAATRYPFVADIVGNTICADLMDYLRRDHYFTGLPAKLGHRFMEGFYVTRTDQPYYAARMAILVQRGGRRRPDVVSELLKYLRYRYELSERALVHHAKLSADAMVGKALEMWKDATWINDARKRCSQLEKLETDRVEELARALTPEQIKEVDGSVREHLEAQFLQRGDDGLLEYLASRAESEGDETGRWPAIRTLVRSLLNRDLYKQVAHCSNSRARANNREICSRHGSPDGRRHLERAAAKYAGLQHAWHVLVWIPSPKMRLKAAEVLVTEGKDVVRLVDFDSAGLDRGREIYDCHRALWGISVFMHPQVTSEQRSVVLAYLAKKLNVSWDGSTSRNLEELSASRLGQELELTREQEERLASTPMREPHEADTFENLVLETRKAWSSMPARTIARRRDPRVAAKDAFQEGRLFPDGVMTEKKKAD